MRESLYALAVFASPGSVIDDDLRRGYGVCEETDRGNLSSSRKSRAARAALRCHACFVIRFFYLWVEKQGKKA
jgi:hypothetical protein